MNWPVSWLVPSALGIAAAAALLAVALHFIARSRPLAEPLPTARFVPARPIQARARSIALSDLPLLVLRIAAMFAIGLAVAGPRLTGRAHAERIVLADRSRATASVAEVRDSVRLLASVSDRVIPFDSAALPLEHGTPRDSIIATRTRGSLSAGLAAAIRVAASMPLHADSVELVIVSPFAVEEMDAATAKLRAAWLGRVRLVRVTSATTDQPAAIRAEVLGPPNDAVAAGLAVMGVTSAGAPVRVIRHHLGASDSLWALQPGHVLVHWPAADTSAEWQTRPSIDAIGGVTTASGTLVARLPRLWLLSGTAVAHWSDGEPAAVEYATGDGCIRDVGILIDQASDITLHEPFRELARALLAPCGGTRRTMPVSAPAIASLAGSGPLAAASLLRGTDDQTSRWTLWLLLLGALLLLAELAVRRTRTGAA